MIYLALGSNLGNRLENLRQAVHELEKFFEIKKISHVIETEALLTPDSPKHWNLPHLNMMVAGNTCLPPRDLLKLIKDIEQRMGRDLESERWSPRIIDIDIVLYHKLQLSTENLAIPHKEIENRDFWRYLLKCLGVEIDETSINDYKALNYFVLNPKFVKIVNITPDSFSDGYKFFRHFDALKEIDQSYKDGATYIELGAQSTRPGYKEVPPEEEIRRLEPIIKRVSESIPLAIDSYFDEVVNFCLENANIKLVNDIKSNLSPLILKKLANKDVKVVTMQIGTDLHQLEKKICYLKSLGIEQVIIDPGIGFGKTKFENLEIIRNIKKIKSLGCEILLGHSRKSFMSLFSNENASDRDLESIAISDFAWENGVDYLRIHNLKDHMRFFVSKKMMHL